MALKTERLVVVLCIVGTQHTRHIPCLIAEILVGLEESLGVECGIVFGQILVCAILRGIQLIGRSEELVLGAVVAVVVLHTTGHVEPAVDLVVERERDLIAGLVVDIALALSLPVGVLHTHIVGVGPVLYGEVAVGIIALIVAELAEVVACGEEVDGNQRVVILSL